MTHGPVHHKSRGALTNRASRFSASHAVDFDDGWASLEQDEDDARPATRLHVDPARRIISRNNSPDVPFNASINPYKGCSHGCIYCFARPTHEYLDHSAGLDFETEIYYKPDAAARFEAELRAPGYRCEPITLGANTDPYQPDERQLGVTRELLEVADRYNQPLSIITKGALINRDIDLLAAMAERGLISVMMSMTSLDAGIKRTLEPRAAGPQQRLRTITALAEAGIPVGALIAPVIPAITDQELESLVEKSAAAGAATAGYVLLRLPHSINGLFREWLDTHYPQRADHVMSLIQQMHGGQDYDSRWGARMRGTGVHAQLLRRRFELACKRAGIGARRRLPLDSSRFRCPPAAGDQHTLDFG
ncbi:radical SAM domain protein [Salinisphaera dokdonensis CL-ES53]|uniref:Radical SAM domain protein n=1 Tax=Salinisphaera dokdonensis CL-ES53 TaxID=1304272 RepID=A0ABV2B0A7_9GAMM